MSESGYTAPDTMLLGEDHVRRYRETDGEEGYIWNGVPILLLTTTGRKSGQKRTSALIYAVDGDDFLVVASQGGAPTHPNWYWNIVDDPEVEIQVKADHIKVHAHAATDDEKPRVWDIVAAAWPNYNVYQTRTERLIPVVILSPVK